MQSECTRGVYSILISMLLVIGLFVGCSHKATDAEIASEVQNKINADPNIPTKQISVGNSSGVVTLSGSVGSDLERIGNLESGAVVCATCGGKPVALARFEAGDLRPLRVLNL